MAKKANLYDVQQAIVMSKQALEDEHPTTIVTHILDAECQAARLILDDYSVVVGDLVDMRAALLRLVEKGIEFTRLQRGQDGEV